MWLWLAACLTTKTPWISGCSSNLSLHRRPAGQNRTGPSGKHIPPRIGQSVWMALNGRLSRRTVGYGVDRSVKDGDQRCKSGQRERRQERSADVDQGADGFNPLDPIRVKNSTTA
jgi:hypothetical protein